MATIKVIKSGIVSDLYGKRFNLDKISLTEARHLIREGCQDIEIVEDETPTSEARIVEPTPLAVVDMKLIALNTEGIPVVPSETPNPKLEIAPNTEGVVGGKTKVSVPSVKSE